MAEHLIGLMLGTEEDWPAAFEALVRRAGLRLRAGGTEHVFRTERIRLAPFRLRDRPRPRVVIDRLAWWYTLPREWLKKVAMMDEVYLLNDPFTFQSMEKHTAYCAMMRLGLRIPETWLLPTKVGPDNERYPGTASRYNDMFDLDEIASRIGYPLYMKPFDGGGWVGVTRIDGPEQLHVAYDASGQRLMHLQAAVGDYEHFARSLSIGPQTRVMRYRPERPMHDRYETRLGFLEPDVATEVEHVGLLINAFFRWEFNSCETIVKDGLVHPIDFANACPDVSLVSLHAHFPWAITALVRWCAFCAVTGRRMAMDMAKRAYFEIAAREDLDERGRLEAYRRRADAYFDAERFEAFRAEHLGTLDDAADEYFDSAEFDDLLVGTVTATFPAHERDDQIARLRAAIAERASTGA